MDNEIVLTLDGAHPEEIKVPELGSVVQQPAAQETVFSAGAIDESMLSDEERSAIEQFASKIDLENVEQTITYGLAAQRKISDFSVAILDKVRTVELGDIGESLRELTVALDASLEPEKKGILGAFQKAKRSVDSIRANYAKAETNVDRIERDLQAHQRVLSQDIVMYQQMFDLNLKYYKELTMYIIAGKKALDQARRGKLAKLEARAQQTVAQEDVQAFRDFEDLCSRFDKKLNDLELTRMIAIQTAPQIRMLQNNAREMMDKLQSSLVNTIPLWRNQLVLSLGIEHSRRAIEAQKELTERTNRLLQMNAEKLKMATVEAAKASESPVVEIDTLRRCNEQLITSVTEVLRIHEEGKQKRERARKELIQIEEDLKRALLGDASAQ